MVQDIQCFLALDVLDHSVVILIIYIFFKKVAFELLSRWDSLAESLLGHGEYEKLETAKWASVVHRGRRERRSPKYLSLSVSCVSMSTSPHFYGSMNSF